jgi:hypothetical protein
MLPDIYLFNNIPVQTIPKSNGEIIEKKPKE